MATETLRRSKHDQHVQELSEALESRYDYILQNLPLYSPKKRQIGEIDILALVGDSCDIFEVKCSHRLAKARHQLYKIKRHLEKTAPVRHAFFYCGDSAKILKVMFETTKK